MVGKNIKKKYKEKIEAVILHVLFYAMIFLYSYTFVNMLDRFNLIDHSNCLLISSIISAVITIIICTYIKWEIKDQKNTRLSSWLSQNAGKILLCYTISLIFFSSVKTVVIWAADDIRDIIIIQWSIFAISVTIFLVWNVVILQYLKNKKPTLPEGASLMQISGYIKKKELFYQDSSKMFSTVTLLTINLVALILATASAYLSVDNITIIIQNIVYFSFLLCTNTVLQLFLDILQPIKEEKRELLKGMEVTAEDVELSNKIQEEAKEVLAFLERIDRLDNISGEEKFRIKSGLLLELISPPEQNAKKSEGKTL